MSQKCSIHMAPEADRGQVPWGQTAVAVDELPPESIPNVGM